MTVSRTMTSWAKAAAADAEKGVPKRESTAGAVPASTNPSNVDFYSQKNCAAQYNLLLKLVEPPTPHGRRTKRCFYFDCVFGPHLTIMSFIHPQIGREAAG